MCVGGGMTLIGCWIVYKTAADYSQIQTKLQNAKENSTASKMNYITG